MPIIKTRFLALVTLLLLALIFSLPAHAQHRPQVTTNSAGQEYVNISSLPTASAITRIKGNGEKVLYIFSAIDCPFCVKLERYLDDIDNITTYTFLLPLGDIHLDTFRKSRQIWCAPAAERGTAWATYFKTGELPSNAGTCDTPLPSIRTLAYELGIGQEVAMIFADGYMSRGQTFIRDTQSAQQFEQLLIQHQKP